MVGYRKRPPLAQFRSGRNPAEALADLRFHPLRIAVAHRDYGHQFRPIPGPVKRPQIFVVEGIEYRPSAPRQPLGVARSPQQRGLLQVPPTAPGARVLLLQHRTPHPFNRFSRKIDPVRPVLQHQKSLVQRLVAVGGHLQFVHRLIETRVCVYTRTKGHADRFQKTGQFLAGKALSAVERHALDKVGHSLLVLFLEHRSRLHCQPQFEPILGRPIAANVVAQSIIQDAPPHVPVHRHDLLQKRDHPLRHASGNRLTSARFRLGRRKRTRTPQGNQTQQ